MFINVKSYNFSSNFGLVLILLLIISAQFLPILCQTKKVAIVSITTQNGNFDRDKLEQITTLLNNEVDLNVAIFLGDFTKTSSLNELNTIYSELSSVKLPFNILCGFKDYSNHINFSSILTQVINSEDFIFTKNDNLVINFNSFISGQDKIGFIKRETLDQISENLAANSFNTAYLISNNPINKIQNNFELFKMLRNKYVFSFYSEENKFSALINSDNNVVEIGIPKPSMPEISELYLIEEKSDSIFIEKKNYNNQTLEILFSAALKDLNKIDIQPSKQTVATELITKFTDNYKTTSTSPILISTNKIYTILDNGLIYSKDFSGKDKFVTEVIGSIKNNSVLYKDLLLVSTFEGDLYSINSNNGEILQVVGIGENITSDLSLFDIGNIKAVTFGTSDGNIFCYDIFSFELIWKKNISNSPIISNPAIEKDKITFIDSKSSLFCANSKSGILNWQQKFNEKDNFTKSNYPLSDIKNIYSLTPDGNLFAIDLLLGKKNWSINSESIRSLFMSFDKQKIFTINSKGLLTIVSSKEGKEVAKLDFKKSDIFSFVIAENEEITLIGFSDGSLYSIDINNRIKELIKPNQIPITSINLLSKNEFVIKDINGNLVIYKIS